MVSDIIADSRATSSGIRNEGSARRFFRIASEEPGVSVGAPVELSRLRAFHILVNIREPGASHSHMAWLRRSARPVAPSKSRFPISAAYSPVKPANGQRQAPLGRIEGRSRVLPSRPCFSVGVAPLVRHVGRCLRLSASLGRGEWIYSKPI
jgi:hypothetical protein